MVDDVEAALAFYTQHFGFTLLSSAAPAFADLTRSDLRLLLSGEKSSAGRPMPDGRRPAPGGWNRIQLTGPGGSQILVDDPSGNPIELFQPTPRDRSALTRQRSGPHRPPPHL